MTDLKDTTASERGQHTGARAVTLFASITSIGPSVDGRWASGRLRLWGEGR